ncbi:hypothetical protein [Bordetella tumulicola]|uniref:hypothetical protein n=1 Tax=Bordetella tumulicola TaxID=1649133 RepID=UPI0039EFCFB4
MSHIVSAASARSHRSALRTSVFCRLGIAAVVAVILWMLTGWALDWRWIGA